MSLHLGTCGRLAIFLCLSLAWETSQSLGKTPEFETTYNQNFLRTSSLIGTKPTVSLLDAQGQPFDLSSAQGKYTVVVFGCLTWGPFLRNISGLETVYRDYHGQVNFYYIYKRLAHPETNNFQEPANLKERLLHVAEAQRMTATQVPWLCDTMDDKATKAFGETYNGEFVLDPEGKIVRQRYWSNPKTLRSDLTKLVGPVAERTRIDDLAVRFHPEPRKIASGVVKPIALPRGLVPIQLKYAPVDDQTLFVKLRAEMTTEPVNGRYQMYLGFYVDPIYKTHWNNTAGPVRVDIKSPKSMCGDERVLHGPNVEVAADVDPRMFLLNFAAKGNNAPIKLKFHYMICDDAETFCRPVTQQFEVTPVALDNGSTRPGIFLDQVFGHVAKFDKNYDGNITRREITKGYASLYMSHIDYNLNNIIEPDELKRFNGMYNNGRGVGRY